MLLFALFFESVPAFVFAVPHVLMTDLATVHDRESSNSTDYVARRRHCQPQLQPVRGRDLPDGVRY